MSVRSIVKDLYLALPDALAELERRRADRALVERIDRYLAGSPTLPELKEGPKLVFAPPVVSPNFETLHLMSLLKDAPLPAVFYEFRRDRFVHLNFMKRCLGRLNFVAKGSGSNEISSTMGIVDFQTAQGRPMNEITT